MCTREVATPAARAASMYGCTITDGSAAHQRAVAALLDHTRSFNPSRPLD